MTDSIDLRLFASLAKKMPDNAARFPIEPGTTIAQLVEALALSPEDAKLIFIDGTKGTWDTKLFGGERVGIFPPIGGG